MGPQQASSLRITKAGREGLSHQKMMKKQCYQSLHIYLPLLNQRVCLCTRDNCQHFPVRQLRSNILEGQKEEMLYCGRYQSFWMMCAQLSIGKFPRTEEENPCLYIQHPQVSIAYLQNQKSHLHHQAEQVLMQRLSSTSLPHLQERPDLAASPYLFLLLLSIRYRISQNLDFCCQSPIRETCYPMMP